MIKRIVKVEDTREFAYVEGKLKPIAGTGEARECSRCGRLHEVHAHVETDDGIAIVGTGCMGAASLVKEARKLASRATASKKRAAEEAEQARKDAERAERERWHDVWDKLFSAWLWSKTGLDNRFLALRAIGGYSAARQAFETETGNKRP